LATWRVRFRLSRESIKSLERTWRGDKGWNDREQGELKQFQILARITRLGELFYVYNYFTMFV